MTKATDLSRPQPRAGVMDIEAYVPGKSGAHGAVKVHKLSSNENPLGSSPKVIEAVRDVAAKLGILSRRRGVQAARGDRRGARAEPGQHRLFQRLGRDTRPVGADLPVARRRGDLHRARLPRLQDLHPGGRCGAGLGQGDGRARRRRRHPGRRLAEDQDRLPRQPEQSDRHLPAVRGDPPPACRPAEARACSCSTRLTPNMSAATTTKPASSWSATRRTS